MWGSVPARLGALAALVALAAGAGALYVASVETRYDADAQLLVSPVPAKDQTFAGFTVLRDAGDRSSVLETVARLVRTPEVAEAVQLQLGLHESRQATLDSVAAHPLGGSSIVAVVGRSSIPERAAQIANAFAAELVAQRTVRFQTEVAQAVAQLERRLRRARGTGAETTALARRLAVLRGLVGGRDPTLQVASNAVAPTLPATRRSWWIVAVLAGAALLAGGALLLAAPAFGRRPPRPALPVREPAPKPAPNGARAPEVPPPPASPQVPPPRAEPTPEPEPDPVPLGTGSNAHSGSWSLPELQRLVEERGHDFPDRMVEWESYLFFLREHAGLDGRLPSSFDWLVEDTFRDLLAAAGR